MAFPATDLSQIIAGEYVDQNDWNALVDALNFMADPPACNVYHNAAQSIPHGAETSVSFNTESHDTDTMHDTVTNNTRVTFNTAGIYQINTSLELETGSYTAAYMYVRLNGATLLRIDESSTWAAGSNLPLQINFPLKFAVNDYVELRLYHTNAAVAARNTISVGERAPHLSATWIGRG
jgi:hypothetical protein